MLLVGMNSWIRSSNDAAAPLPAHPVSLARSHPNALRAGIAIALVALAMTIGIVRPAETAAYKSNSTVCTTLEAGFNYAGDMYTAAQRAGDTKTMNYWAKVSSSLQGIYLDLDCSYSNYEGPAA